MAAVEGKAVSTAKAPRISHVRSSKIALLQHDHCNMIGNLISCLCDSSSPTIYVVPLRNLTTPVTMADSVHERLYGTITGLTKAEKRALASTTGAAPEPVSVRELQVRACWGRETPPRPCT